MRTHQYLTRQYGENATTPRSIVAVWHGSAPDGVDMAAVEYCCLNSDDNRLIPVPLHGLAEVALPEWMDAAEYVEGHIRLAYAVRAGMGLAWPEAWVRGIMAMRDTGERVAVCELLATKKFRSAMRASLRDQVVTWLETAEDDRQYTSPLSARQMACITRPEHHRLAKCRAAMLHAHMTQT